MSTRQGQGKSATKTGTSGSSGPVSSSAAASPKERKKRWSFQSSRSSEAEDTAAGGGLGPLAAAGDLAGDFLGEDFLAAGDWGSSGCTSEAREAVAAS